MNQPTNQPGARILVVDDEISIRRLLVRFLEKDGYRCAEAIDGHDALEKLAKCPFEAVFTDLRMPRMGGLELLTEARKLDPMLAIIVVTGLADRQTPVQAMELGAWGWVAKPFDRNEVRVQALNALERRRLEQIARREHDRLEEQVRERTSEIHQRELELAQRLVSASEMRDQETGEHVRRIGILASRLAQELGWKGEDVEDLQVAAMMHDIGKIGIPDCILQKPGPLTAEEFSVMKRHAEMGARILDGTTIPMLKMARQIAMNHHERWDGRGYPRQLRGAQIPQTARIVSIVDVFDALSHDRVYRPARTAAEVLDYLISERGGAFDPRILDIFLERIEELTRDLKEIEIPALSGMLDVSMYPSVPPLAVVN